MLFDCSPAPFLPTVTKGFRNFAFCIHDFYCPSSLWLTFWSIVWSSQLVLLQTHLYIRRHRSAQFCACHLRRRRVITLFCCQNEMFFSSQFFLTFLPRRFNWPRESWPCNQIYLSDYSINLPSQILFTSPLKATEAFSSQIGSHLTLTL